MKNLATLLLTFFWVTLAFAQSSEKDSVDTRLHFNGDFRFRVEYDWDSRKGDGSYRNDRTRLRYRFRLGLDKKLDSHFSLGARIRTGTINDQQGPHLTIGGNSGEFGINQLGFEKIFLKYENQNFWGWIGKNSYPFFKQHEMLWNDNVFPEGLVFGYKSTNSDGRISFAPTFGHFIFKSYNTIFDKDAYLNSLQLKLQFKLSDQQQIKLNFGNLYFHNMPDIPDGQANYLMHYNIINTSLCYDINGLKRSLSFGFDIYRNTVDYKNSEQHPSSVADERTGLVFNFKYGQLKKKSDILFHLYLASIGKFAIVDFLAQNDWARWDYSSSGAAGSRLSNFNGLELRLGYQLTSSINLISRFYYVSQKVKMDDYKENGYRFRIDLNAKF